MRSELQNHQHRVLVVSDDNTLIADLNRHLSFRPVSIYFAEGGAAVRMLIQRPGLRFLALGPDVPARARAQLPQQKRFRVIELGDLNSGIEAACEKLDVAVARVGTQESLGVGIIGVPDHAHQGIEDYLKRSRFMLASAYSREEALSRELVGAADVVLLDSKLGQIDQWRFALQLVQIDPGKNLPLFGIVPRIDVDILQQSVEHRMAGFLLRSLIDERLFPRLEAVVRASGRVSIPPPPGDQRYAPPNVHRERLTLSLASEENQDSASVSQVFGAMANRPGAEDERAESLIGQTFGKVRLESVIGRGGNGTVYCGWHRTLDTAVAVKVLFAEDVARDERFAHRFIEEARIAARIEHPNIVRVIDFDRDDESGCYYLVMELVRGVSLLTLLRDQGAFYEDSLLDIAEKVCEVLAVAERFGIVHRDITPGNILITEQGSVKLADLGIAKFVDGGITRELVDRKHNAMMMGRGDDEDIADVAASMPLRTATGVLLGTPHYVSPEQSRDARLADSRCDMYSLGATLFHAATGHPPFVALTVGEVIRQHREQPPPDIRQDRPSLSKELSALVARLLQKEPAKRYPSYERLLEEIHRCRRMLREREILEDLMSRGWRGRLLRWTRLGKPRKR